MGPPILGDPGVVDVLYGTSKGPSLVDVDHWSQGVAGIDGGDFLGSALAPQHGACGPATP